MIAWRDEGVLLSARRHGEADAIIEALTAAHGRHAGVVKGGGGRRMAQLQPGTQIALEWRARLADHLGTVRVEPLRDRAGAIMADACALAALSSAAALLCAFLPEREPCAELYARSVALMDALAAGPGWGAAYARWELDLLATLGFGLDLSACAATGATGALVWVSPRTGRAVSAAAGAPYADRLLALPSFLLGEGEAAPGDLAAALRLTGWFLDRWAAPAFGLEAAPPARARLAARIGI